MHLNDQVVKKLKKETIKILQSLLKILINQFLVNLKYYQKA